MCEPAPDNGAIEGLAKNRTAIGFGTKSAFNMPEDNFFNRPSNNRRF
jgi:hypothetical protein